MMQFTSIFHRYQEIIRFCIVGVLATGIHYGIYLLLNRFILVWLAYTIGYVISFICNFYLTSIFTFKSKATIKKGIGFIFCHFVNYMLHLFFLTFFIWLGMGKNYAPIPVYLIVIPINFLLVRFVFKTKKI